MAILIPNYELGEKIGERVEIEARTVAELIEMGTAKWGEVFRQATKRATIVVNGRAVSLLRGGKTPLGKDDSVWLIVPSGGG